MPTLTRLNWETRPWDVAGGAPIPGGPVESEHWDDIAVWQDLMNDVWLEKHTSTGGHDDQAIPRGLLYVEGVTSYANVAEACVISFAYTEKFKSGIVASVTDHGDGSFTVNLSGSGLTGNYQPIAKLVGQASAGAVTVPPVCTGLVRGPATRVHVVRTSNTAFRVYLEDASALAVARDAFVVVKGILA